jgi:hypothetical protein
MILKSQNFKKTLVIFLDFLFIFLSVFSGKITSLMMENLEGCEAFEKFGIKCLTCGGTRCVNALANGRIKEAFLYNSFVPVALAFLLFVLVMMNASWIFNVEKSENLLKKLCDVKFAVFASVLILLYIVLRNVYSIFFAFELAV